VKRCIQSKGIVAGGGAVEMEVREGGRQGGRQAGREGEKRVLDRGGLEREGGEGGREGKDW